MSQLSKKELAMLAEFATYLHGNKANPHGPGGLIASGSRPDAPVAIVKPDNFAGNVPVFEANDFNAQTEVFSWVSPQTGSAPTGACETPATAGDLRKEKVITPFGHFFLATGEVDRSAFNLRRDFGDRDVNPINAWITGEDNMNPFAPIPEGGINLNTIWGKRYAEFGVNAANAFSLMHMQGDSANTGGSSLSTAFIDEYDGLDTLISTAKYTAPGLDPIVVTGGTLGSAVVADIINVYRGLQYRSRQSGMPGVKWSVVVNPAMMYELFDTWACNYATTKCDIEGVTNDALRFDGARAAAFRDEMIAGMFLLIDGIRVPVIADSGVARTIATSPAGQNTSTLFFVPMDWAGRALTYFEYLPYYRNTLGITETDNSAYAEPYNGGLYLRTVSDVGVCIKHQFNNRGRLIMDYPFLAGRVDDIVWTPQYTYRDPIGFTGGGVTAEV